MRNALNDTSFQDMFLTFCIQNAPICHTENTACLQKEWEEVVNLARGMEYSQGFWYSWENGGFWQQERAFLYL